MSEKQHGRTTHGYWRWAYEFSKDPFEDSLSGFGYFYLGSLVLFSPIAFPIYWLGRLSARILEGNND